MPIDVTKIELIATKDLLTGKKEYHRQEDREWAAMSPAEQQAVIEQDQRNLNRRH